MRQKKQANLSTEIFLLLVQGSLRSIPFNAILAILLGIDFIYNQVPVRLVVLWLIFFSGLILIRWLVCRFLIKKEYYLQKYTRAFAVFYLFAFLMGITWGLSYFIFLPYFTSSDEALFIVVLGGLAAGSIASMSMCMPAYYAYVIPMFVPLIIYNVYLWRFHNAILAIMYALFLLMIFLTAQFNSRLLLMTSKLNKEKDQLIEELTETNLKLQESIAEVRTMSITDSLTNIFNRRYFDMILSKELSRAKRGNYDINLVFIDIDNFKWINDNFGHPSGDEFLIYVAEILRSLIRRASDIIFRLGGDEFAAILSMPTSDVVLYCSRIQSAFDKNNKYKNVTLSMGILALKPSHVTDYQSIINAADHSLYEAKKSGKNKNIFNALE